MFRIYRPSSILKTFSHYVGAFFYPSQCLHCETVLDFPGRFLCEGCAMILPWLDPISRCNRCFLEECQCSSLNGCLHLRFAAFAHEGPAASLVHQLKFHGREEITKVLASSLLLQIDRLKKWPDMIVPVPHAPLHAFLRNNYPSKLLARELGHLMKIPVKECLKRSWTSLPQRTKTKEQREKLPQEIYRLQKRKELVDRTILLVDDVTTTGTTLVRCAEALREGFPCQVLGCTVTLAEKD